MPETRVQHIGNHARFFPLYHFFALPVTSGFALYQTYLAIRSPSAASVTWAVYTLAVAFAVLASRVTGATVQDRVIRLEETLRLQRVLPASMQSDISRISRRQFVALRFASDEELPDLVRRTLAGDFAKQKDIKKAVKSWRADWLRV